MKGISFRVFVIGNLLSFGLPFISILVLSLVGIAVRPAGTSIQDAVHQMPSVGWFALLMPILGALSLMLTGYITAALAGRYLLLNGLLATTLLMAANVYVVLTGRHTAFDGIANILVSWGAPLLALAGAYLRVPQAKRRNA